jgi:hypothetical protein
MSLVKVPSASLDCRENLPQQWRQLRASRPMDLGFASRTTTICTPALPHFCWESFPPPSVRPILAAARRRRREMPSPFPPTLHALISLPPSIISSMRSPRPLPCAHQYPDERSILAAGRRRRRRGAARRRRLRSSLRPRPPRRRRRAPRRRRCPHCTPASRRPRRRRRRRPPAARDGGGRWGRRVRAGGSAGRGRVAGGASVRGAQVCSAHHH